ncbi:MFS transporter [Paraburkholderia caballeronis]|uniref:Drug resistance transporter, EmrB/QacA subfamily n=1 Tax=Paraburkholderia caballeronis TaxID=416943 RepID=A0A1H7M2U3_9BURK|nr:EmrB/QacA subfamily drug resistance transporter [Paraburkholderia caballeronis]PXX04068.1 EmrB/QacA subfamily drug resistance transporter [Paraburkholderia caballeronis]RAK04812.1 EmrB/QacA subfamily drug resistance transporter [Paraburkholderia caballeronis]SED63624.1 drug resistance transporter, EmrB/QacA subfamily [Paraburkholderia caballeronis]SEL05543.1 drug resistance transporter, EmrB/QacA subfamily [Paraburkholderia caballeronis]
MLKERDAPRSDGAGASDRRHDAVGATAGKGPQAAASPRSSWFLLATASATCALISLDTNIVAVSLPSIARSFHAGFADVEWVVSAYMVSFASCLLPMGGLADRYGRKKMLLSGLLVFALASLGCGLAPNVGFLNLSRAAKGVGASLLLTAALAVIANAFPGPRERARAWAVWGMTMGIATTVAPLVGGVITQWVGWRWIFLLNLPVCAVLMVCAWHSVTDSRNPHAGPVDFAGSLCFGLGLACGIWALIGAQDAGWRSPVTSLRFAACALLIAGFVAIEKRRANAVVDLSLFSQARFVAAVLGMFGYAACAQVMMTFLPLYLQNAFEWTPVHAGVGMLPFALSMIVGPYLGVRIGRHSTASTSTLPIGLALVGAGNLLTAAVAQWNAYGWVALGMIVTGLGAGVLNGDTQKAIMACVPAHRTGMAAGISTTTRFTAIAMSVGVLGAVLASRTQSAIDAAMPCGAADSAAGSACVDAGFMSDLLAGDVGHALARLAPDARRALASIAPAGFATGFAAALGVAGALAFGVALLVWLLAGRRQVDERRDVARS